MFSGAQELPDLDKSSLLANPSPRDAWERLKSCSSPGDTKPNVSTLREISDSRVRVNTEAILDASCYVAR